MELFQHYRVADFKKIIVVYLEVKCLFVGFDTCGAGADPDPAGNGVPLGDLPPRDQEGGLSSETRICHCDVCLIQNT